MSESLTLEQLKDIKKVAFDLGASSCNVTGSDVEVTLPASAITGIESSTTELLVINNRNLVQVNSYGVQAADLCHPYNYLSLSDVNDNGARTKDAIALSGDGLVMAIGYSGYSNNNGICRIWRRATKTCDFKYYNYVQPNLSGSHTGTYFGASVALNYDGKILVISNGGEGFDNGKGGYVSTYMCFDWNHGYQKFATDIAIGPIATVNHGGPTHSANAQFGKSLALNASGTRLVVGSPSMNYFRGINPATSYGNAYVYDLRTDITQPSVVTTTVTAVSSNTVTVSASLSSGIPINAIMKSQNNLIDTYQPYVYRVISKNIHGDNCELSFNAAPNMHFLNETFTFIPEIPGNAWTNSLGVGLIQDISGSVIVDDAAENWASWGYHVAISGDGNTIAIVGKDCDDKKNGWFNSNCGGCAVFKLESSWVLAGDIIHGVDLDYWGYDPTGKQMDCCVLNHDGTIVGISSDSIAFESSYANGGCVSFFQYDNDYATTDSTRWNKWRQMGNSFSYPTQIQTFNSRANAHIGRCMALSGDGHRVIIGGKNGYDGSTNGVALIYQYNETDEDWEYKGSYFCEQPTNLGTCVDISEDGGTIMIGAIGMNNGGGAYAFQIGQQCPSDVFEKIKELTPFSVECSEISLSYGLR